MVDAAAQKRVLLIDERHDVRRRAAAILRAAGCEVFIRESPIGATAEIARENIEVAVIGLGLSVMGGDRFAELVRRNDRLDHVGVVLISDGARDSDVQMVAARVRADGAVNHDALETELVRAVSLATRSTSDRLSARPPAQGVRALMSILVLRSSTVVVPLTDGRHVVGRDPDCRLVLRSDSVSRRHAAFEVQGVSVTVEDLGSSNGTAVNGDVVRGKHPVEVGDVIRIGHEELTLASKRKLTRETLQIDEESLA